MASRNCSDRSVASHAMRKNGIDPPKVLPPILAMIIEIRGVTGVYELDSDGFLLGSISARSGDPEAVAAVAATLVVSCERMGSILGLGTTSWIIMEYRKGKMVLLRHETKIWVIITAHQVMLGDIILKLKGTIGPQSAHPRLFTDDTINQESAWKTN